VDLRAVRGGVAVGPSEVAALRTRMEAAVEAALAVEETPTS
jgi:hypothetical protein